MMIDKIKNIDSENYMNTFGTRLNVCFTKGSKMVLTSTENEEYLDFLGGIAVNSLGHSHPHLVERLQTQIQNLLHVSNLYYIKPQAELAQKLVSNTCMDRAFFANSGAEANEGAIKLAKLYFYKQGKNKFEVISLNKSFHGRTIATISATGQEKYQKPFKEFVNGFKQVEANNFEELKNAITDKTAAILLEPIQGESGVHPMNAEYLKKVRNLCDENDILLIFDEVQTGMGRCGALFAYELFGVEPDIMTSAKALGGGVPIGAFLAKQKVADAFSVGDHGTTFGGNPLATTAGLAVFEVLEKENLIENCKVQGEYFKNELLKLQNDFKDKIIDIRAFGLLVGIELKEEIAKDVFTKLFENKILSSLCGNTLRLAPPLIITKKEIDIFITTLKTILSE